jgi:hypothetical protein
VTSSSSVPSVADPTDPRVRQIAQVVHEANRAYCKTLGDYSQYEWHYAEDWQVDSVIAGVIAVMKDPTITPEKSHHNWMQRKIADGWTYAPAKNSDLKKHPCIAPYNVLPETQKMKDKLFIAIVKTMLNIKDSK